VKHEPASDIIDTAAVDSLKALDPKRPIREATELRCPRDVRFSPDSVAKVVLHWWLEILRAADVLFV